MARYIDSVCRLCRREGEKLFFKGERCLTNKCSFDRRGYAPGQHGQRRTKVTDFGTHLREKQKVKRMYGLTERQFHLSFTRSERQRGVVGENLLRNLELRLDNVAYRSGFGESRSQCRQLARHGHFLVNGRRVSVPSFRLRAGDVLQVREKSKKLGVLRESLERVESRGIPAWLELDKGQMSTRVRELPRREDITSPIQEQLIVEFYSR